MRKKIGNKSFEEFMIHLNPGLVGNLIVFFYSSLTHCAHGIEPWKVWHPHTTY